MTSGKREHFLWCERYRPKTINDCILPPNAEAPIPNVVKFLKSKGIKTTYAAYGATSEIIMYSNGEIQAKPALIQ